MRYILRRRGEGAPFRAIAAELTAQGIPTKRGGAGLARPCGSSGRAAIAMPPLMLFCS